MMRRHSIADAVARALDGVGAENGWKRDQDFRRGGKWKRVDRPRPPH